MKKYISVLALDVKNTIFKVLGILILMSAVQLGYFYLYLQKEIEMWHSVESSWQVPGMVTSFDWMLTDSRMEIFFMITVALICLVLIWGCSEHGKVRSKFTWHRLQIERRQVFAVWVVYRVFCMALVVAWQILLTIVMDGMYQEMWAQGYAPQSLFLACYRNHFMHGLVPFSDPLWVVRNVCFILFWGMGTAYVGYAGFAEHQQGCGIVITGILFTVLLFHMIGSDLWFKILCLAVPILLMVGIIISVKGSLGEYYDG